MYVTHTIAKHPKRRQSKSQIKFFFSSNIATAFSSFLKAIEMSVEWFVVTNSMILLHFAWGHHFRFTIGLKCFTQVWTSAYHNYSVRIHLTSPKSLAGLCSFFPDEIVEMSLYCYWWSAVHVFDLVALKSSHSTSRQRTTRKINLVLLSRRKHGLNGWSWHVSKDVWNGFGASPLHQLIYVWELNKGTWGKGDKREQVIKQQDKGKINIWFIPFLMFFSRNRIHGICNWVDKYFKRQRLNKQPLMKTIYTNFT